MISYKKKRYGNGEEAMKDSVLNGGNYKEVVSDFHLLHGNIIMMIMLIIDMKRR